MGVLRWPDDASSGPDDATPPPLAHDSQEDIPIQHLRWGVAAVHGTPSLARLFPPAELEVGARTHILRSSDVIQSITQCLLSESNRMPTTPCTTRCRLRPPPPSPGCWAARVGERRQNIWVHETILVTKTAHALYHRALVPADGPSHALRRGERGARLGRSVRSYHDIRDIETDASSFDTTRTNLHTRIGCLLTLPPSIALSPPRAS